MRAVFVRGHSWKQGSEKSFHQLQNIVPLYKGHLQVKLRELRLAVAARVFITEAACDWK